MKITVFGASGFIGQHVLDSIEKAGYKAIASDFRPLAARFNVPFMKVDIMRPAQVDTAVKSSDMVINLAASPLSYSLANPVQNARVNIIGGLNILEACRKFDIEKVIFSSASSIIGDVQMSPVDESHPCRPKTPYGVAKYALEHYHRVFNELYGLDYTIFRFFNVYGPGQYPQSGALLPTMWSYLRQGNPFIINGDGQQVRDYIYVTDVSDILVSACKNQKANNTMINMGTGIGTTIKDMVAIAGETLGVHPKIKHAPPREGEIMNFVASTERLDKIFRKPKLVPLKKGMGLTFNWLDQEAKI